MLSPALFINACTHVYLFYDTYMNKTIIFTYLIVKITHYKKNIIFIVTIFRGIGSVKCLKHF